MKSDISSPIELNQHLGKLAESKKLREEIPNPSQRCYKNQSFTPQHRPLDHMFTFLIGNKFKFAPKALNISYAEGMEPRFQHNAVISIEDGGFFYRTDDGPPNYYYPATGTRIQHHNWIPASDESIPFHFRLFLAGYYNAMNVVTLLEPDMAIYLSDDIYN